MKKIIYVFAVLMILSLFGCNSEVPNATAISGNVIQTKQPNIPVSTPSILPQATTTPVPTNTLTPTPIPTFTPTPTLVPISTLIFPPPENLSGFAPQKFNPLDFAISNQNLIWYIKTISVLRDIDGYRPPTGKQYLLLQGYIYNYNLTRTPLYDVDFPISYLNVVSLLPDPNLMGHLKNVSDFSKCNYPNRNTVLLPLDSQKLFIESSKASCVFLVYETDLNIDEINFGFQPNNSHIRSITLTIKGENYGAREGTKMKENEKNIYYIADTIDGIERVISSITQQPSTYKNCSTIEQSQDINNSVKTIDKTITLTETNIRAEIKGKLEISSAASAEVSAYINVMKQGSTETQNEYSESVTDKLKIPPYTIITITDRIEIVEQPITVTLRYGDQDIYVTYTMQYKRNIRQYSDRPVTPSDCST